MLPLEGKTNSSRGVHIRQVFFILIALAWAQPAAAGLGDVLNGTGNTGTNTGTTSGSEADDEYNALTEQLDSDFNDTINAQNERSDQLYEAVEDGGSLDRHYGKLDSTLEAMYNDINNGGTAAGMETAGEYKAPTLPDFSNGKAGEGGSNEEGSNAASGDGYTAPNLDGEEAGEGEKAEDEAPSDPRIAAVLEVCTPACTPEGGTFNQDCASACARNVLGVPGEPSATDSLVLMSILGE